MRSALSRSPASPAAQRRKWAPAREVRRPAAPRWGLPRDVELACGGGVALGTVAAATAYWSYLHAGGPTRVAVAVVPASLLVVAAAYAILARRRQHASDWLGLGYTVAVVGVTGLLMLWEVVRGLYEQISFAGW